MFCLCVMFSLKLISSSGVKRSWSIINSMACSLKLNVFNIHVIVSFSSNSSGGSRAVASDFNDMRDMTEIRMKIQ